MPVILLDPWSSEGVVVAVIIPEGLDLRGANDVDPGSVIQARKLEGAQICHNL